jgi:methyl-accepting chemotaxis protein
VIEETPIAELLPAGESLEVYLRLEEAIDKSLHAVIGDTESSAQAIIQHVRRLHDSATQLVSYLDGTTLKAGDLGKEIQESVAFLVDIGAFIEQLPAKTERDRANVQAIVKEIMTLSEMTADVQAISQQSHLIAINVAIEASRDGNSSAVFKVLADEMRRLAGNSRAMAVKMNLGLNRAREIAEGDLASTIAESSRQLADASNTAASIGKLRANFDDMSEYYKTRFAVLTRHNEDLVKDIAEVLGQIQYQDVVRQAIERTRATAGRRNAMLRELVSSADDGAAGLEKLPQQLELILEQYLQEEDKHRHSSRAVPDEEAPLKIELF